MYDFPGPAYRLRNLYKSNIDEINLLLILLFIQQGQQSQQQLLQQQQNQQLLQQQQQQQQQSQQNKVTKLLFVCLYTKSEYYLLRYIFMDRSNRSVFQTLFVMNRYFFCSLFLFFALPLADLSWDKR